MELGRRREGMSFHSLLSICLPYSIPVCILLAVGVDRSFLEPLFVEHKGMVNSVLEGSDFRVLEDFIFSFYPGLMAVMFESLGTENAEHGIHFHFRPFVRT